MAKTTPIFIMLLIRIFKIHKKLLFLKLEKITTFRIFDYKNRFYQILRKNYTVICQKSLFVPLKKLNLKENTKMQKNKEIVMTISTK